MVSGKIVITQKLICQNFMLSTKSQTFFFFFWFYIYYFGLLVNWTENVSSYNFYCLSSSFCFLFLTTSEEGFQTLVFSMKRHIYCHQITKLMPIFNDN